jgi:hypothetical protein
MERLELDNEAVELGNNVIALTKQAYAFDNPEFRYLDISNRINLPQTQVNRLRTKNPNLLGGTNRPFESTGSARYFNDTILFNGAYIVDESTGEQASVQLIDSAKIFFEKLRESIRNLSLDTYDFTFNVTSYESLKDFSNSVWVWPVISMHIDKSEAKTLDPDAGTILNSHLRYSRPFFSVKRLIELIFENENWSLNYESILLDGLVFSSNHDKFYLQSYNKTVDKIITTTGNLGDYSTDVNFNNGVSVAASTFTIDNTIDTIIRVRGNIVATGDFTITLNYDSGKTVQNFFISETDTEINISSTDLKDGATGVITITVTGSGTLTFDNCLLYTLIDENNLGDLSTDPIIGYNVATYDNIQNLSKIELFKVCYTLLNGYLTTDTLRQEVNLNLLNKLSKLNAINWSNKFISDREKLPKISDNFGNFSKVNYFSYSNDETVNEFYGRGRFDIDNNKLEKEGNWIEIAFSASYDTTLYGYDLAVMEKYADTIKANDLNIRLLYAYRPSGQDYTIARFQDLHGQRILDNYYFDLIESFKRLRYVENAKFDLRKGDFLGVDFSKLVYIKYYNSYFYILNVENFVTGRETNCNLLKFR